MIVEAIGAVDVKGKTVDASGLDSTKVLWDKLEVDIFSKYVL